jgi:glycosyltransferase involved in cell wall biosynthesis
MTVPPVTIVAHNVGGVGGMERQLEWLVTGLLEAGGEVTIISRTCRLPTHHRMRWIRVPGPNRPFPLAFPWFYLAASIVTSRRRRGLVHTTGSLIANRVDLATVHFCHLGGRRHGGLGRRRRADLAYTANAWLSLVLSEITERWSYRSGRVRRLVAVSPGVGHEVRSCFPRCGELVETIPNGVDFDEFRPDEGRRAVERAALGLSEDALAAVFVGGDWERKGLAHALAAVGRRPAWHLLVVGAGDEAQYRRHAAEAGCADRVHFAGEMTNVSRFYLAGDAFILPSHYESFSLATYEAAASGLPLLVTRVSGVEDILSDGENGWFISPDADTIEPRLAQLEADLMLRTAMGRKAHATAQRFDWASVVSAYCDLYRRLASNGATRPAANAR